MAKKDDKKDEAAVAAAEEKAKEKAAKKKEKKSQKERPKSKTKHAKVKIWKLYSIDGDKLTRKTETCPRCGAGTFLPVSTKRKHCGKCFWSQIEKEKPIPKQ